LADTGIESNAPMRRASVVFRMWLWMRGSAHDQQRKTRTMAAAGELPGGTAERRGGDVTTPGSLLQLCQRFGRDDRLKVQRVAALNVFSRRPKITRGRTSKIGPMSGSSFHGVYFL
jgi:hypothetical protein